MPWGRLHDQANGSAKLIALSDAAWRMWGCALIYCQANLTDGFIPKNAIATFGVRARDKRKVINELCRPLVPGKGPCWHRAEGGYQVHDYLDWNDSRATIQAGREKAASRFQRFKDRLNREPHQESNAVATALQRLSTPTPTTTEDQEPDPLIALRARFDRFWTAYPRKVAKPKAAAAFRKVKPTDDLLAAMLAALERQGRSDQWRKDGGQFIPHPSTWLHQRRWEDESTSAAPPLLRVDWRDDCARLHASRCTNVTFHEAMLTKESA